MNSNKTKYIILSALFAALTCISTMVIQLPSPTGGYIHLGDAFVLLSGVILGPIYGSFAGGIGSMLADLLSGYAQYAPATLIIKGLAAFLGGFIFSLMTKNSRLSTFASCITKILPAGIICGMIVTGGYLLFESFLLGNGLAAAITGIPANILQNVMGILISCLLLPFLSKVTNMAELRHKNK